MEPRGSAVRFRKKSCKEADSAVQRLVSQTFWKAEGGCFKRKGEEGAEKRQGGWNGTIRVYEFCEPEDKQDVQKNREFVFQTVCAERENALLVLPPYLDGSSVVRKGWVERTLDFLCAALRRFRPSQPVRSGSAGGAAVPGISAGRSSHRRAGSQFKPVFSGRPGPNVSVETGEKRREWRKAFRYTGRGGRKLCVEYRRFCWERFWPEC